MRSLTPGAHAPTISKTLSQWSSGPAWLNDELNPTAKNRFSVSTRKYPIDSSRVSSGPFSGEPKNGERRSLDDLSWGWNYDADAQRMLSGIHAETTSKDVVTFLMGTLPPKPPGFIALLPPQKPHGERRRGGQFASPLVWPLSQRSSCVPVWLYPLLRPPTALTA